MPSQYDKLGEMLKDALENGAIPQKRMKKEPEEYESFAYSEKTSSVIGKNLSSENGSDIAKDIFVASEPDIIHSYDILELENGTPPDIAKDSYRKLLKKYHPDNIAKFENMQKTAAKKTGEIIKAYKILEKWFEHCLKNHTHKT
jgi:dnaJ domain